MIEQKKYIFEIINFTYFAFNNTEEGINQAVSYSITNMTQKEFKKSNSKILTCLSIHFCEHFWNMIQKEFKESNDKTLPCLSINLCEQRHNVSIQRNDTEL